jgi:hypothetical protein
MTSKVEKVRLEEEHFLILFSKQLAHVAVAYGLNTWDDAEFESCVEVFHGLAKCN